jgi:hypothetical protein
VTWPSAARSARQTLDYDTVPYPDDTEGVVPRILAGGQHLVEESEHLRAVLLVHTAQPRLLRGRLVGSEAVDRTEALVPVDVIGAGLPRPRTSRRRIERQPHPPFALAQRRLDVFLLGHVDHRRQQVISSGDLHWIN